MKSISRLILFLFVLVLGMLNASAQVASTSLASAFTNSAVVRLTNGTYTAAGSTNVAVDVYQSRYLGFFVNMASTNATTSNVVFTPSSSRPTAPTG